MHDFLHIKDEKKITVYILKTELFDMILLDSIGRGCFNDIDFYMMASTPSTLFIAVIWLSLLNKIAARGTLCLMKNVYTYLNRF